MRLTRNFATACLLDTVIASFDEPVRLTLRRAVDKFEIIGDRTPETRSMILNAIELERAGARSADGGAPEMLQMAAPSTAPLEAHSR